MIKTGKYNELIIVRQTSVGLYLGDGGEPGEDVLLPNKYCPEKYSIGDTIKVFVYRDSEDRKIATTLTPKILLYEFAFLPATAVSDIGVFVDWGLEKGLLVPFAEQRQKMKEGESYVVFLDIDQDTDRLYASNDVERNLQNVDLRVEEGEEVDVLVFHESELGFSVIINNIHEGLVYKNETFRELNTGDRLTGYVKKIREGNKIDISLQPLGYRNFNDKNTELVYQRLIANKGFLSLTDKSSPEEIYTQFGISKKAFKMAIGALYKQRKITIEPAGIKKV